MPWSRPASVPVGRVWSRFEGKPRDGRTTKYQVRDMEEADRKRCLDMMQETFLQDEPLCHILGITSDPESIATIRNNWESFVDQHLSVACYTELNGNPHELVGFNILLVKTIDEEEDDVDKVKGEPWKKLLRTLVTAEQLVNVFQRYGVTEYLTSSGLTVIPQHRGQNIGARIIDARRQICAAMDLRAAATVYTAVTSQVLAGKCGYQLLAELPYADMKQHGVDLDDCPTSCAKLMGREYTCVP